MGLGTLQQTAEARGITWNPTIQSFAEECYQLGRQSIFQAQKEGRQQAKAKGKKLGRPLGKKDGKHIKRNLINKYKYYLRTLRFLKQLPESKKQEFMPKIETIETGKDYVLLKGEIQRAWLFEGLGGINEIC
jgi:hypothetical protein